jgi:hypothetical protein
MFAIFLNGLRTSGHRAFHCWDATINYSLNIVDTATTTYNRACVEQQCLVFTVAQPAQHAYMSAVSPHSDTDCNSPCWSDAHCLSPWQLYFMIAWWRQNGDVGQAFWRYM